MRDMAPFQPAADRGILIQNKKITIECSIQRSQKKEKSRRCQK